METVQSVEMGEEMAVSCSLSEDDDDLCCSVQLADTVSIDTY